MEQMDLGIGGNRRPVTPPAFARVVQRWRAAFLGRQRAEFIHRLGARTELLGNFAVEGHGEAGQHHGRDARQRTDPFRPFFEDRELFRRDFFTTQLGNQREVEPLANETRPRGDLTPSRLSRAKQECTRTGNFLLVIEKGTLMDSLAPIAHRLEAM